MSVETSSPEANYLTRDNIVHPESNIAHANSEARVAAAEARGRLDIQNRRSAASAAAVTVTGGAIKRGK